MKKVVFGAVALLCGAISFAQSNDANVTQLGSGNEMFVDQIGNVHKAVASQRVGGNLGDIEQSGAYQDATVAQHGRDSEVWVVQTGVSNEADAIQYSGGPDNYILIRQEGSGSGNKAKVWQYNARNDSYTFQYGDGNSADVEQKGNDNFSSTVQRGTNNDVVIGQYRGLQTSLTFQKGDGNSIQHIQSLGVSNVAVTTQTGEEQGANVNQLGTSNFSGVIQSN